MPIVRRNFNKDYFDSLIYRSHPRSHRNKMRLDLVLAHKDHGKLLDIGIGSGDFLQLATSRFDVYAIDVSPYAASRLPARLRARVTLGDIERVRLPVHTYDVIAAFNMLEHLKRPAAVIRKIGAALAPGGIFVGSMPCNASFIGSVHTAVTNFFDRTHRSCYTVPVWAQAFRQAGLPDTHFFGEVMLDGAICVYVYAPVWPHVSLNMMFVSRPPRQAP